MTTSTDTTGKVTAARLRRDAYLSIPQSTLCQVASNTQSTPPPYPPRRPRPPPASPPRPPRPPPCRAPNNPEPPPRQYDLRGRAVALGWSADRIHVIDVDQGHSGAPAADREGFQQRGRRAPASD